MEQLSNRQGFALIIILLICVTVVVMKVLEARHAKFRIEDGTYRELEKARIAAGVPSGYLPHREFGHSDDYKTTGDSE